MAGSDYGDDEFEKFDEFDENLLEDFENELAEEESSRKRKLFAIIGGLMVGAVVTLIVVGTGTKEEVISEPVTQPQSEMTETTTSPEPEKTEDVAAREKETSQEIAAPQEATDETVTKEPVKEEAEKEVAEVIEPVDAKEDIESQIAKLQEGNLIGKDVDAPGMISENQLVSAGADAVKPDESAQPIEPAKENTIEPTAEQQNAPVKTEQVTASPKPDKPTEVIAKKPIHTYSIHVLSTTDLSKARAARSDLLQRGYDSGILTGKIMQDVFRVQSGKFKSVREASRLLGLLANDGFHSRTSYLKGGAGVTIEVGVFSSRSQAEKLVRKLKASGYESKIEESETPINLYHLRLGKYKSNAAANRVNRKMIDLGYQPLKIIEHK